jgi:predicted dehydrogenase
MNHMDSALRVGIIGIGHWGPNHVRVFSDLDDCCVVGVADTDPNRLARISKRFPGIDVTTDHQTLLADDRINAVIIATPTHTHVPISRQALLAGKHVLVEKPMCTATAEARELRDLIEATGLVYMVGHVFLFNNGIRKIKQLIESGELGQVHYIDAVRTNLGPIRADYNALYDLGTHDLSIFNYLLDATPEEVSAVGRCISQLAIEDVCFATMRYGDLTMGHVHVSWMNPRKVRTITVVGDRRMVFWDDMDLAQSIRVYDKGIAEPPSYDSYGQFHYVLRNADVHMPAIPASEPLVNQAQAFKEWIQTGEPTGPTVHDGWRVAAVLESAMHSMQNNGRMVPVMDLPTTTQFDPRATATALD